MYISVCAYVKVCNVRMYLYAYTRVCVYTYIFIYICICAQVLTYTDVKIVPQ